MLVRIREALQRTVVPRSQWSRQKCSCHSCLCPPWLEALLKSSQLGLMESTKGRAEVNYRSSYRALPCGPCFFLLTAHWPKSHMSIPVNIWNIPCHRKSVLTLQGTKQCLWHVTSSHHAPNDNQNCTALCPRGKHEVTSALDGQGQNNLSKKENDDITLLPQDSCSDLSLLMTLGLRSGKVTNCSAQGSYSVDESATGHLY